MKDNLLARRKTITPGIGERILRYFNSNDDHQYDATTIIDELQQMEDLFTTTAAAYGGDLECSLRINEEYKEPPTFGSLRAQPGSYEDLAETYDSYMQDPAEENQFSIMLHLQDDDREIMLQYHPYQPGYDTSIDDLDSIPASEEQFSVLVRGTDVVSDDEISKYSQLLDTHDYDEDYMDDLEIDLDDL